MRLSEAQRLRPGDKVLVRDYHGVTHLAHVVYVTSRGGVLVRTDGGRAWLPFSQVSHANEFVREVSSLIDVALKR